MLAGSGWRDNLPRDGLPTGDICWQSVVLLLVLEETAILSPLILVGIFFAKASEASLVDEHNFGAVFDKATFLSIESSLKM